MDIQYNVHYWRLTRVWQRLLPRIEAAEPSIAAYK